MYVCAWDRRNNEIFEKKVNKTHIKHINTIKQFQTKQANKNTNCKHKKKYKFVGKISGICGTYINMLELRHETWLRCEIKPRIICTWCICFAWMFYGLTIVFFNVFLFFFF